ncbi:hypothetical protein [Roseateles sp.]|uniref:hypothetical protein n=1 Tax=Roseateles sp. TaxID=1971397 RepID=UPI0025FD5390|nr:hypothetical protein [Roseateles sp.]MBV8036368.1 hypothetical protein [Roseateles sp.]
MIPLKAIAWLELTARKEQGAKVDAKDVRKHLNDVLRLSQLLAPATRIPVDKKIGDDMTRFLVAVVVSRRYDHRPEGAATWQCHRRRTRGPHRSGVRD